MALLQRAPIIQVAARFGPAGRALASASVLRVTAVTAVSLGALHTLAGATILASSQPSPLTVPAGRAITGVALTSAGTVSQPNSWRITGSFPPGLSFQGGTTLGAANASTLLLSGTPTTAGSYPLTLQAWEYVDLRGLATPAFNYTIIITAAPMPAPSFTT